MASGACNCGAVAYRIDTDLSDIFICHCSICRNSTGGSGIPVVVIPKSVFTWTAGQDLITYWSKPGHDWNTSFCQNCGTPLPGANDPERMYVPVGSLIAGHEELRVAHHIYVNSRAAWEEIGDSGKQHAEGFSG